MADDDGQAMTRRTVIAAAGGALALGVAGGIGAAVPASSSRDRLEAALARIAAVKTGGPAYLTLYADQARAAADAADARRRAGTPMGPLDGAIVSIKDLFDVAGEPTRTGSPALADAAPARADAPVVQRLRAAGAVIVGKTNMVEMAFSGVGLNPHYGTPANPADRSRVPGGSSSGGGVAVADGLCEIAIGSDTGGSTRIPAALCGIVGYKPSQARVPVAGVFPLAPSFDSIGPIARSVADCARADAVIAGEAPWKLEPAPLAGLHFGIPQGMPLDGLDATVAARFGEALKAVETMGARLSEESIELFDDMARLNTPVPLASVEAFAVHRDRLATRGAEIDPHVLARIEMGRPVSAVDYARMLETRSALVKAMDTRLNGLDVLILPTTPIVAPTLAEVAGDEGYWKVNRLLLRNTAFGNFFDLCAISLPLSRGGGLPVGLMLVARNGQDRRLFAIAAAVEQGLAG